MRKSIIVLIISIVIITLTFIFFGGIEEQISTTLDNLQSKKIYYSAVSFTILTFDILLPVPSSIVMYLNGYVLGGIGGSCISLLSLLTSSIIGYYIGKLTSVGLKEKSENNTNTIIDKYGILSILITRGIPILSESICIVCGYNKVPFKQYFIFNLVGYAPLCLLYAICGSLGYDNDLFFISFSCSLLISFVFWLLGKKFLKTKLKANED